MGGLYQTTWTTDGVKGGMPLVSQCVIKQPQPDRVFQLVTVTRSLYQWPPFVPLDRFDGKNNTIWIRVPSLWLSVNVSSRSNPDTVSCYHSIIC
jgi:hypothetical protein